MPLYCISTVHLPTSNGTDVVLIVIQKRVRDFGLSSIGLHRSDIEVSVSDERRFYGLESLLTGSLTNPSHFDGFTLQNSSVLPLNGRDCPSAIAWTPFGSLHVSHGSKITFFDCCGATDISRLQILDLHEGCVKQVLSMRNSNSILVYDLNTLNPVIEIDHNEIFGADLDSTIPATKLQWVSSYG
ncbi:hypothetical protein V6N13_001291 [Hibiscus sabdariffa]